MCPCGVCSYSPMTALLLKTTTSEWFVSMTNWEVVTIKIISESLNTELVFKNFSKFVDLSSLLIFYFSPCSVLRLSRHSLSECLLLEEVKTIEPTGSFYRSMVASERKRQIIFPFGVGDKHCHPSNPSHPNMEWFPFWSGRKLCFRWWYAKEYDCLLNWATGSPYILISARVQGLRRSMQCSSWLAGWL